MLSLCEATLRNRERSSLLLETFALEAMKNIFSVRTGRKEFITIQGISGKKSNNIIAEVRFFLSITSITLIADCYPRNDYVIGYQCL
jgi:hypothetical protein